MKDDDVEESGRAERVATLRDQTLRDSFAMRALPFCCIEAVKELALVSPSRFDAINHAREASKRAYLIADAMLKAREM